MSQEMSQEIVQENHENSTSSVGQHTVQNKTMKNKNFLNKKCSVMMSKFDVSGSLLPVLCATAIDKDGKTRKVRVLLDTASTASFIKVGPNRHSNYEIIEPNLSIAIAHIEGETAEKHADLVSFELVAPGNRKITIQAYTTAKILTLPNVQVHVKKQMQLASEFGKNLNLLTGKIEIDVLLGAGDTMQVIERVIKFNDMFVIQTPWGSTPCGGNFNLPDPVPCYTTYLDELNKALEKMWKIEEMPSDHVKGLTREENMAVEKIEQNLHFNEEHGRFETALLFKEEPLLRNNYDRALARFNSLQRSLLKNEELKVAYTSAINEFINNGVVELINDENAAEKERNDLFYLPHRAVYDPSRTSTQCRVVFDASAKTATGHSLNSFLLSGPPLQLDITALAMRFRARKIVLVGDISKMFLNIDVREADRNYLRFLWKETHESGPPRVYRFSTLIFGATDSPFQAITCLQKLVASQLADPELTEIDRKACDVILHDTYVDDISTGGNTVEETLSLMNGVQKLLNQAHFFVKKWKTNSSELLQKIPEADRAPIKESLANNVLIDEQDGSQIISDNSKMLGLSWEPENDHIYFDHSSLDQENNDTKTAVASLLAKIYDPLGLVSPFVLKARQVLKKTHQLKLGWKQKLPEELIPEWHEWVDQIKDLTPLQFPRYIMINENSELHVFSDASVNGYGAAAYVRNRTKNGYESQLLIARSKITPVKEQTIPRLELIAALLAAKLAQSISQELKISRQNIFCWSDSEIVLFWLQKKPDTLIPFIANRIEKIQQHNFSPFSYINTSENPADIASRGCNATELNVSLWMHGPSFLQKSFDEWPAQKHDFSHVDQRLGVKKQRVFNFSSITMRLKRPSTSRRLPTEIPLEEYYSSYSKLLKHTANLFRFLDFWQHKTFHKAQNFEEKDYASQALQFWVKNAQNAAFPKECTTLNKTENLASNSPLKTLSPVMDEKGMMRVGGRLAFSHLSEETKHPIILPKEHRFTHLLIKHAHETNMHMGTDWVHQFLRQKYWIISSRQLIKSILKKCVVCAKQQGKRGEQQMAQLPPPRVNPQPPFSHVGIDYTGQLTLKTAGRDTVGYIVVFTCLTTRAVHLELVESGQTKEFIAALKRMIGSKGTPTDIYSDHALIFQKTKGLLESRQREVNFLPSVRWHLSTEAAPHTGGVWERIVQVIKRPLRKVLGKQRLNYTEMLTLCKEVEGIVNDRPLAPTSADSMEAITPSMLMLGRKIRSCPGWEERDGPAEQTAETQLAARNQLISKLWQAWMKEYCLSLQNMHKWYTRKPNLSVGDLVLVEKQPLNRSQWPLARVQEIHRSRDGLVRKVTLNLPQTSDQGRLRVITRSIHNVFPLEMTRENEPEIEGSEIDEVD